MKREERVVKDFDNREISRDSMRSLLAFAQTKIESGVTGSLPFDEVQNAKEFFLAWKRRKLFLHNGFIGFTATMIIIFSFTSKNMDIEFALFACASIWAFYSVLEVDKTKKVYIREMLGNNMSSMTYQDQQMFLNGLLYDLWLIEEEKFKTVFNLTTLAIVVGGLLIGEFATAEIFKGLGYTFSIMGAMTFFWSGTIKVKKVTGVRK